MCSTPSGQLARICRAIEELAARSASKDAAARGGTPAAHADGGTPAARAPGDASTADAKPADHGRPGVAQQPQAAGTTNTGSTGGNAAAQGGGPGAADDIARLAAIWEMIADADPELAKRLPGYLTGAE